MPGGRRASIRCAAGGGRVCDGCGRHMPKHAERCPHCGAGGLLIEPLNPLEHASTAGDVTLGSKRSTGRRDALFVVGGVLVLLVGALLVSRGGGSGLKPAQTTTTAPPTT